jgi:ABC-type phosphate transport system substrate-binding protein
VTEGYADIAFLMDVSPEQVEEASQKGVKLEMAPIGKDAFAFIVYSKNKIQNLSTYARFTQARL